MSKTYHITREHYIVSAGSRVSFMEPWSGILRDDNSQLLAQYFQDLYSLFLKKITILAAGAEVSELESSHLKAMLDELLRVKSTLTKHH